MRASRAEIKIEEILREAGLNFKMEYSYSSLRYLDKYSINYIVVIESI